MLEITWHEPYCSGGGNACLQLGHDATGTPHLRETAEPGRVIAITPAALAALTTAARRGTLPHPRG